MEVLAEVSVPLEKLKKVVWKTNACMIWGGAFGLAAADDKLDKA
jgi:thymidine phosphorylase